MASKVNMRATRDLAMRIDGKDVRFLAVAGDGNSTARVICPDCGNVIVKSKARRHYLSHLGNSPVPIPNELSSTHRTNDTPSDTVDGSGLTSPRKQLHEQETSESDETIWERLRQDVPSDILTAVMKSMHSDAYHLNGFPMILPPETLRVLQALIPADTSISRINLVGDQKRLMRPEDISTTHEELTTDHLIAIEAGSSLGLERMMGAILITGSHKLTVLCAEVYSRDIISDPHAESKSIIPSSVPTNSPTTQYAGRLKIALVDDNFNHRKLVIGVRGHNYLVTAANLDGSIYVGPSRCSAFLVNATTRIYIKKDRQDVATLSNDILGLAQVRSAFGHPTTYTQRRAALQGHESISLMPITIFTLCQFEVPLSRVFRELAMRAQQQQHNVITLHVSDIEAPQPEDQSAAAKIVRRLIGLFPKDSGSVRVTGNQEMENTLTELASQFSRVISNKNLTVARRIALN